MRLATTILILICSVSFLRAQDGKPTKEQTVNFIKRYFEEEFYFNCIKNKMPYTLDNYQIAFNAEANQFTISYLSTQYYDGKVYGKTKYTFTMDLSKIESVKYRATAEYGCEIYFGSLIFEVATGEGYKIKYERVNLEGFGGETELKMKNIADIDVFLGCIGCVDDQKIEKLRLAFDHLRKLCGAPDPVKF